MSDHVQDVRRGIVMPTLGADTPQFLQDYARTYIAYLAQQLQFLHASFEAREIAVPLAAANVVITWTTPAPTANYVASVLPSWATTVYYSNRLTTSIQANFGVVAPAGAVILVLRVR